jgi:hypothetical protein
MFTPITSEITIKTGMILQEIASGRDFEVGLKLNDGSDRWYIKVADRSDLKAEELIVDRQTLAMKYFAEID